MSRKRILSFVVLLSVLTATILLVASSAFSLAGSNFEAMDGNLKVDNGAPAIDWANVTETRVMDEPTGSQDDSFTNGTKEDTVEPVTETGSIPPNKSDLKTFGVYVEENAAGKFLAVYWTRVQEPNGTTNMDFEFNQSTDTYANGIPVRTAGDLLIVYELSRGGTVPNLFLLTWLDGTEGIDCDASNSYPCWGDRTDLDAAGAAEGSINEIAIPAAESDGLGDLSARTFGEALIDLDFIFNDESCESFGSAYLKSRSSDSFTSALKDYIAPEPVNISNCGSVTIRKETIPDGTAGDFDFTPVIDTDPPADGTTGFALADGEFKTYTNVLSGTGYTVTESDTPGFVLTDIDCSASSAGASVTPNMASRSVEFDVAVGDTIDCTFYNTALGNIVVDKVTLPAGSSQSFSFTPSYGGNFNLTDGASPHDSGPLQAGTYSVSETVPAGWDQTSATCNDGSDPSSISLGAGETVTCTFTNTQRGTIIVEKQTNPDGAAGSFTFTGDVSGSIGDGGQLTASNVVPGSYTSTENDPSGIGYRLDSIECDDTNSSGDVGTRTATFELDPGETVTCSFTNSTGAILVSKTAKNVSLPGGSGPQQGVTFTVNGVDKVTNADGEACFDYLVPGQSYNVTETVPDNYAVVGDNPKSVLVSAGATCDTGTPDPVTFVNTPLSEIEIIFRSLAGPGVTKVTSISCTGPSADGVDRGEMLHDESEIWTDLEEGVYTCTIVVDP